jgi:hypothetical protein
MMLLNTLLYRALLLTMSSTVSTAACTFSQNAGVQQEHMSADKRSVAWAVSVIDCRQQLLTSTAASSCLIVAASFVRASQLSRL